MSALAVIALAVIALAVIGVITMIAVGVEAYRQARAQRKNRIPATKYWHCRRCGAPLGPMPHNLVFSDELAPAIPGIPVGPVDRCPVCGLRMIRVHWRRR